MKKLLGWIFAPPIPHILALLLITAVIIFGGRVLRDRYWSSLTDDVLIGLCIGVWVIALLVFVWRRLMARKRSRAIEDRLRGDAAEQVANTRPDRRGDVEALRKQLDDAIEALSSSKMGKRALSDLPWYVIIGPPGSGKSTLLRESGLNFPHLNHDRGVRGLAGTRNCDWWFTDEGILLDTAGRYTTEDEDLEEWLAFLAMLKRSRPRTPINGAIVAISIADLIDADDEQLAEHADKIRHRILELTERLQLVFPVYVVFTKCDLLDGFVESFQGYSKKERGQIWGFTLPYMERKPEALAKGFPQECEELAVRLSAERLRNLAGATSPAMKRKVFSFPLQFAHAQERLAEFVSLLEQPNPYHESSDIRGIYFTSGTQEGAPLDRVLAKLATAANLSNPAAEESEERAEKKAYFIDKVFSDVVFPDASLARSSAAAERRRMLMQRAMLITTGVATVALAVLLVIGFAKNSNLIARAGDIHAAASEFDPSIPEHLRREASESEAPFARLRKLFVELDDEYGGLTTHVLGATNTLYEEMIRPLYVAKLRETFIERTQDHLLGQLEDAVRAESEGRGVDVRLVADQFTAYTMLAGETRLDRGWLEAFLRKRSLWTWGEIGAEAEVEACRPHREVFIARIAGPAFDDWTMLPKESIIPVARDVVEGNDVYGARLNDVLARAGKESIVTMGSMLESPHSSLMDTEVGVTKAFAEHARLEKEIDATGEKLGDDGADRLREARRQRAIKEWLDGLAQLKPKPKTNLHEAVEELGKLTGEESPYIDAYQVVCRALSREDLDVSAGDVEWLRKALQEVATMEKAVRDFCKNPHTERVISAAKKGRDGEIQQLVQAFNRARQTIRASVVHADPDVRDALEQSLIGLVRFFEFALAKEVYLEVRSEWGRVLGDKLLQFGQKLPFAQNTTDFVTVPEFEAVFREGGELDEFILWGDYLDRLPMVEHSDEFKATRRFAEKLRGAFFATGDTAENTFLLVMQNQGDVSNTRLKLTDEIMMQTRNVGTVRRSVTWTPSEGAKIGVIARVFDATVEPWVDAHAHRPWGLMALLSEARAEKAELGEGRIPHDAFVWTFEHPVSGEPLAEDKVSAKIFVRTESGPNPLAPNFFEHAFSVEVFRDPQY